MPRDDGERLNGSISYHEIRQQLKKVLESRHFVKAKKKSRFLEFLCEQSFAGNTASVNEYVIGVDLYSRGADFDPHDDAIVRVQAHEIRKSLAAYYDDEGRNDRWQIDLPAGGYVPLFTRIKAKEPETAPASPPAVAVQPRAVYRNRWIAVASLTGVFVAGWLLRNPGTHVATRLPEGAAWFWQPFLPPAEPPLVVIPVHPLLRAAHGGDSPATWRTGQSIPKDKLPEFRDTIHSRELAEFQFVPNLTDFTGVGEALGLLDISELLRGGGQRMRVDSGRLVDFEAIKRVNTILLGGFQSWSGRVFRNLEGFEFTGGVILNKQPLPGEQALYKPEFDPVNNNLSRDYALVLMLPNEQKDRRVMLIYGIYSQGTQAGIEYVTSPERLAELRRALIARSPDHKSIPKYFQVLLSTTVENYVPGRVSLVSTRPIPE